MTEDGQFTFKNFGGPGISWMPDSKSILYSYDLGIEKDNRGERDPQIKIHNLGQDRSHDRTVFDQFESPQTTRWGAMAVGPDKAIAFRVQGVATIPCAACVIDLKTGTRQNILPPNQYLGNSPGNAIVGVNNGVAYFRTSQLGNNYGIASVDLKSPISSRSLRTLIPNDPESVLYQASLVGDKILTQNINHDLTVDFRLYDLSGNQINILKPSQYGLPDWGHPSLPLTEADATSTQAYFTYSSVEAPPVTFKVDAKNNRFERMPDTGTVPFDSSKVKRELVTYKSHDGKEMKMFIYKRTDQEGILSKFAYLYSYGFIGIPNLPQWNRKFQLALELGATVALPVIRGGGEFGADFQLAGTKARWNTFKDHVYASRWLKQNLRVERVIVPVASVGRSFGGLTGTVHYVHHQKDFDLISAIVPVTDWESHFKMSGWWMGDDFGVVRDPATGTASPEAIAKLIQQTNQWNPSQHLKKLRKNNKLIPAIFFSGQYDTNTTPMQTVRFIEQVRKEHPDAPIYMFEHPKGGHSARAELVDEMLFIARQFGLTEIKPIK